VTLWRVKLATLEAWSQGKASDADLAIDWPDAGQPWGWFGVRVDSRGELRALMRAVKRDPAPVAWNQTARTLSRPGRRPLVVLGSRRFARLQEVLAYGGAGALPPLPPDGTPPAPPFPEGGVKGSLPV
jgi:hypothetical protein